MKGSGGKRAHQVGEEIFRRVALILLNHAKDPRLNGVTITGAKVSDDLGLARIFFAVHTPGEDPAIQAAQEGLERACGYIKRELGKHVKLKKMPELVFTYDSSFNRAARVEALLHEIHEQDSNPEDPQPII